MELSVAAKSTKPGSKANMRRKTEGATPGRVPVGELHVVDIESQPPTSSMFTAVCGEGSLMCIDNSWDEDLPNDRCEVCADHMWKVSFEQLQQELLN